MSFTLVDTLKINWPSNNRPTTELPDVPSELIGVDSFVEGYALRNTAGRTFLVIGRQDDADLNILDPSVVSAIRESFFLSPTIIVEDVTVSRPISAAIGAATKSIHAEGVYTLAGIERLANLEVLDIPNSFITSLDPLRGLANLHTINLKNCDSLVDLTPLLDLPALQLVNVEGITYTASNIKTLAQLDAAVIASIQFKGLILKRTTITLSNAMEMILELVQNPITSVITGRFFPPVIETPTEYLILRGNGNTLLTIPATGASSYAIPAGQTNYILNNTSSIKFITEETPAGVVTGDLENFDNGTTVDNPVRQFVPVLDLAFDDAMQTALFKTTSPYTDEITNLKYLNVSAGGIENFTGLELFTSLTKLDVSFNPIVYVPYPESLIEINGAHGIDDTMGLSDLEELTLLNIEGATGTYLPSEGQTVFQYKDSTSLYNVTLDPANLIPAQEGDSIEVSILTKYIDGEFHVYVHNTSGTELDSLIVAAGEDCDNADEELIEFEFLNEPTRSISYTVLSNIVTGTLTNHGFSSGDAVYIELAPSPLQGYRTITVVNANSFTVDGTAPLADGTSSYDTTRVNKLTKEQLQSLFLPSIYFLAADQGRANLSFTLPIHLWAFSNESLLAEYEKELSVSDEAGTIQTDFVYNPFTDHYYMDVRVVHTVQDPIEAGIYGLFNDYLYYDTGVGTQETTGSVPDPENIGSFIDRYTYTIDFKLHEGDLYLLSEQGRLPVYFNVKSTEYTEGEICSERRAAYDEIEEAAPATVRIHTNYSLETFKLNDLDIVINPGDEPKLIGPFSSKFNFAGQAGGVPVTNLMHLSFKCPSGLLKLQAYTVDPSGVL